MMDEFDQLSEWLDENNTEMNDMSDKAMRITDNKGFQLDLPNGVTVSVQFGPGNYCDPDVQHQPFDAPKKAMGDDGEHWGSNTAECAAYVAGSNLSWVAVPGFTGPIRDDDDSFWDDVVGYLDVQGVLDFINLASQLTGDEALANPNSLGNRMLSSLEDERKVMEEDSAPSDQYPWPLPGQKELDFDDAE